MFRSLFLFRRLLATSFLLVFVNVFVGQCWCATLEPGPDGASDQALGGSRKAHSPRLPGPREDNSAAKAGKHAAAKHDSKPAGKQQDCCKDNSAAILKSLATPGEKQLLASAPALLPASTDFFFRPAAGQWDRTHAVVLVLREHLPPKIPDIRIFIQSLTV